MTKGCFQDYLEVIGINQTKARPRADGVQILTEFRVDCGQLGSNPILEPLQGGGQRGLPIIERCR